jgi:phosphoribosylformylglycinamidine cyclo-ligase
VTSYREAGVDLEAADQYVDSIAAAVVASWNEEVVGGFGGFAAGVEIPSGYRRPVLMMSTDGVGTKLDLARRADRWDGVGSDLVAMCLDDLAALGAHPLGMVDYLAVGSLQPDRDSTIVASIAEACREAGCPLLGGETAEHPGVMAPDAVDLAGAVAGVLEKGEDLGPHRVDIGDVVVGLSSPNLRANGFSLVRAVLGEGMMEHAEALLQPSVVYTPRVLAAAATGAVHAAAHVTGGGIVANLARALGRERGVVIEKSSWEPPPVFDLIASAGVADDEMYRVFNMGIGFCLVVDPLRLDDVLSIVEAHQPMTLGEIEGSEGVSLV